MEIDMMYCGLCWYVMRWRKIIQQGSVETRSDAVMIVTGKMETRARV